MSWTTRGRGVLLSGVTACVFGCVFGCGGGEGGEGGSPTGPESLEEPGEMMDVPPPPVAPVNDPPATPSEVPLVTDVTAPDGTGMTVPDSSSDDPDRCRPAAGVSGSPTTIPQALELINALPKPTSLACFLQALDRPLTLFMTESALSLQPSSGARSPRTFVLRNELEMSIVFDGETSNTLELGYRTSDIRSIKAEVAFPVRRAVSESTLFDRIQETQRTTVCGRCHVREVHLDYPGFPNGVFESDVYKSLVIFDVELESLKAEAATCDENTEFYRCELLSALFDHGETVQGQLTSSEE